MSDQCAQEVILINFKRATSYVRDHKLSFISFILFLIIQDLANFALSQEFATHGADPRLLEVAFQLFFLWSSVYFYHTVSCVASKRKVSWASILGESILLFPGYILQSILWTLSLLAGLFLLIIPGVYSGVVFYMAPMISVLYPDYSGTTFTLSREFAHHNLKVTFAIVLTTSLIPFIPEGLLFFITGSLKSIWGLIYSPIGGGLYLFCELVFLFFVLDKVEAHRSEKASI